MIQKNSINEERELAEQKITELEKTINNFETALRTALTSINNDRERIEGIQRINQIKEKIKTIEIEINNFSNLSTAQKQKISQLSKYAATLISRLNQKEQRGTLRGDILAA